MTTPPLNGTLTDVAGLRVGHAHDLEQFTGCTVVLCPSNTVAALDQRGGAPGTRETDLLRPMHLVQHIHAVFLSGGSAFGLAVGDGVMRYLVERDIGHDTSGGKVPIVPGAILFDLDVASRRPDAEMGHDACQNATAKAVPQGSVGAGTGAKVGGMLGSQFATKGGIGSASIAVNEDLIVAAMFAVNAAGDVLDERGSIIAGLRLPPAGEQFADALQMLRDMPPSNPNNTVIGVVASNAQLSKEAVNKVAQMAHDGLARAIRPAHTPFDGDTIFALATGEVEAHGGVVGAFAAEVAALAIRNAIYAATPLAGMPTAKDLGAI